MNPMARLLAELLQWSNLWSALLWFALGVFLAWNRGVAASIYVPLVVTVAPAMVSLGAQGAGSGHFHFLPLGADGILYVSAVIVPMLACIIGGQVAAAINPRRKGLTAARNATRSARDRAEQIERDINEMIHAAHDHEATSAELTAARMQVAQKQAELREIDRVLNSRRLATR